MFTARYAVPAIMLTTMAMQPALAETCNFTMNGRTILDDELCTASNRGAVLRIEAVNAGTIIVRRSVLMASLAGVQEPFRRDVKRYRFKSFGLVVKSVGSDDKACYFNQTVTLCIER